MTNPGHLHSHLNSKTLPFSLCGVFKRHSCSTSSAYIPTQISFAEFVCCHGKLTCGSSELAHWLRLALLGVQKTEITKMAVDRNQMLHDFITAAQNGDAALFIGAGLSMPAGFVNWKELLRDLAEEIGLDVDREPDLVTVAQYHINRHSQDRSRLNQIVRREFDKAVKLTPNHQIISRLPIQTVWTTNYDTLLEEAYKRAGRVVDIKLRDADLSTSKPNCDLVLYKMHGDISRPDEVVLSKDDYGRYAIKHPLLQQRLGGDLVSKTFLFLGFSFTDSHLEYVLGHLRSLLGNSKRPHFAVMRKLNRGDFPQGSKGKRAFEYESNKQELMIEDLRRYSIYGVLIDDYKEVTEILAEVERHFYWQNVFISGSANKFGAMGEARIRELCQSLGMRLVKEGFKLISGFGLNIGDTVILGALSELYENNPSQIGRRLLLSPFPTRHSSGANKERLYNRRREEMISTCGAAIFIAGNSEEYEEARGVLKEFEIAKSLKKIPIPIGATGFAARQIWNEVMRNQEKFYMGCNVAKQLRIIGDEKQSNANIIEAIFSIIKTVTHLR